MATNREVQREAEARYRERRRLTKDHGDYDWVAVLRVYNGDEICRKLTSPEKVELVRLILRAGGTAREHSERMNQREDTVWHWLHRYGERARAAGLDDPLRFCFLPEEALTVVT